MVSGQDQNVSSPPAPSAPADGGQKRLRPAAARDVAAREESKSAKLASETWFYRPFFHLFEGRVEQRVQTGPFTFLVMPQLA